MGMNELREKTYSTADVMKTFGLGRNALRFYEELGLLNGLTRTESGYREFKTRHLEDLKFILEAKRVGFSLNEIEELLKIGRGQNKMTCGTVSTEISGKVREIEEQLNVLEIKKLFLADFLKTCGAKNKDAEWAVIVLGFSKSACSSG